MSKTLVIAEKPELGRAIAAVIVGDDAKEHGGIIENDQYVVTWAFGHLLELCFPSDYDKQLGTWTLDPLPIEFRYWKKKPVSDKGGKSYASQRERLRLIGSLLKDAQSVIHAGDPDDEGQVLIDEILDYFHYQGEVKRVLINDNLPSNIKKQFGQLQNNEDFKNISNSAYARSMADYCFGINHSRLASIRLHTKLNVGRVQTPTLNLVVERDLAIKNHVKQKYYELNTDVSLGQDRLLFKFEHSKELSEEKRLTDRVLLEQIGDSVVDKTVHCMFTNKDKLEAPPLPYNATEIQADMNGKYGYSLNKTLQITQALRDKYHAITYNRSDCQYLSEEHHKEAPEVMKTVLMNLSAKYPVDFSIKSKCFNDSKISAHHGIIPQNVSVDISKLSEEERNVYVAICERYIMQFLPPIKKRMCEGVISNGNNGRFVYRATQVLENGYLSYFKNTDEQSIENKVMIEDGNYQGVIQEYKIEEKETKPLKKYTPKSLIKDMCGISKYVKDPYLKKVLKEKDKDKAGENGSIGTVATRAQIIEHLVKNGYVEMQGKYVVSTAKGQEFCSLLPDDIKSADITAKWWLIQESIKEGKADVNAVMDAVVNDFRDKKDTLYIGKTMKTVQSNTKQATSLGKCPLCKKDVFARKKKSDGSIFYGCDGYKDGCTFSMPSELKYFNDVIKMSPSRVTTLLSGKTIRAAVTAKDGSKYNANLKLVLREFKGRMYPNLERVKNK